MFYEISVGVFDFFSIEASDTFNCRHIIDIEVSLCSLISEDLILRTTKS